MESKKTDKDKVKDQSDRRTRSKPVRTIEPRTPAKRSRVPVQKYQSLSDDESVIPTPKTEKKIERALLFNKGDFLAVRNEEEGFFICRAMQNIYKPTKAFKIQWLSNEEDPEIYKLDYCDTTELECVLCSISLKHCGKEAYKLPLKEVKHVKLILKRALCSEKGLPLPDSSDESDDEEEEAPSTKKIKLDNNQKTPKKNQKNVSPKKTPTPKANVSNKRDKPAVSTPNVKTVTPRSKATPIRLKSPPAKQPKTPSAKVSPGRSATEKKGPDKHLSPNARILVLNKEPFFETKEDTPFISKYVCTKQVIRAVLVNDMNLLKNLLSDPEKVDMSDTCRSVMNPMNALHYAIEKRNFEAIKILGEDTLVQKENPRLKNNKPQSVLIQCQGTGSYNFRTFGVPYTRNLKMGRGNREGNNALTKDVDEMIRSSIGGNKLHSYIDFALKTGAPLEVVHTLLSFNKNTEIPDKRLMYCKIHLAVLNGHRKLAGQLIEEAEKFGGYGFNFLHKEMLQFENEELRVLTASPKKKPLDNVGMTPLHCAAINPNVKYLAKLLSSEPDFNIQDKNQRRLVHYAAACQTSSPLELLVERGASLNEADKNGMLPLHYAVTANRLNNAEFILKKAKSSEAAESKYGPSGINCPNNSSYCPIHISVDRGLLDMTSRLIKFKADVNKALSARLDRLSPLMLAASKGFLEIARILVQSGALIEQADKMKRTVLTIAVMNGNTHVASYLLRMGADPNHVDSSGNSVVHYAAAYGWYHCLKLLIEVARAEPNKANDWKMTPVAIAFLKGHIGLVDYLLIQKGVDINFKDDKGMTLVSIAAASALVTGLYSQVAYLIQTKGADCTTVDMDGNNALHHLAQNNVHDSKPWQVFNDVASIPSNDKMQISVKVANLLIDNGCDVTKINDDGQTPLMLAIEKGNIDLAKLLVQKGSTISASKNKNGKTVLHLLAEQCVTTPMFRLVHILAEQKIEKVTPVSEELQNGIPVLEKMDTDENNKDDSEKEEIDSKAEVPGDDMAMDLSTKDRDPSAELAENDALTIDENCVESADKPVHDANGEPPVINKNEIEPSAEVSPQLKSSPAATPRKESISGLEILRDMSRQVDHDGFTPLLRACAVYRDGPKNVGQREKDKVKDQWRYGREFIKAIIEVVEADVNDTVQQKYSTQYIPPNEDKQYIKEGKWSALHFLVKCNDEEPVEEDGQTITCPSVKLLLMYNPHLELTSLDHETPLILAIESSRDMAIQFLLSAGANPNFAFLTKDKTKTVPLLLAAKNPKLSARVLEKLLLSGSKMDARDESNGYTALHYVVLLSESINSQLHKLRVLVDGGSNVNLTDNHSRTPLHLAVNNNTGSADASLDVEVFLIEKGSSPFMKDDLGRTPLHYAFTTIDKDSQISTVDPVELCSLLTTAMQGRNIDDPDIYGRTALHYAAARGATISCMHLLQRGADVNKKDKEGNSVLSLAVLNKHISCAIMLLQREANARENIIEVPLECKTTSDKHFWRWRPLKKLDEIRPTEYSIFQGALTHELHGLAHLILDMASDSSATDYLSAVEAALCVNKYHFALRLLARVHNDNLLRTWVNKDQQTLIHILVLNAEPSSDTDMQFKLLELLHRRGIPLESKDKHSCTALIYAALKHNYHLGFYILNNGRISIDHRDKFGRDAMAATFWNTYDLHRNMKDAKDWLSALKSRGSSLDLLCDYPGPDTLMFGFTLNGRPENYFQPYPDSITSPLIVAIRNCEFDLVQFMLKNGASGNFADSKGITPLMHSVKMNDIMMVKLLLNNDYDPDAVTSTTHKPNLTRKLSRQLFTLQADIGQVYEEAEKEPDPNDDESGDTDIVDDEDEDDVDDYDIGSEADEFDSSGAKKNKTKLLKVHSKKKKPKNIAALQCEDIHKTSDVNLDVTDAQGWNIIHHLICPLDCGSYDNTAILNLLAKVGAPLHTRDHSGLTPLENCLIRGTPRLAAALQQLTNVESENMEKPVYSSFDISDGIEWKTECPDVAHDAADMLKRHLEAAGQDTSTEKHALLPDRRCNIYKTGEVVVDHSKSLLYDVILSKVDVTCGPWGLFNFYRMQLVRQRGKDLYILFTCWGRIGDDGQFQHTPCKNLDLAVKEFHKLFKSKTGNEWNDIEKFKNYPKKYSVVPREQVQERVPRKGIVIDLSSSVPSILTSSLQKLMGIMTSPDKLVDALKLCGLDTQAMPLGRIKREAILEARAILQHIASLVKLNDDIGHHGKEDHYQENMEKVARLSNDYFRILPKKNYAFEKVQPISDEDTLNTELKFVSDLLDYDTVSQILLGAQKHAHEYNPLDYVYQSMQCKLRMMSEDDIESQYILKYIHNSNSTCKVEAIFKVSREGEENALASRKLGDHRLLWHGSSVANFISILKHGLLQSPPNAANYYTRGIYLADAFNKSLNYCSYWQNESCLMLLCEVALGKSKVSNSEDEEDEGATEYNSTIEEGEKIPDPTFSVALPYGAVIPLGPLVKNPTKHGYCGTYSEYIVNDPSQVCIRYLVQFSRS